MGIPRTLESIACSIIILEIGEKIRFSFDGEEFEVNPPLERDIAIISDWRSWIAVRYKFLF